MAPMVLDICAIPWIGHWSLVVGKDGLSHTVYHLESIATIDASTPEWGLFVTTTGCKADGVFPQRGGY